MAPAAPVFVLHFVRGKYQGQDFALEAGKAVIAGRSTEADLVLSDDAVSRKHARFHGARGRIWVRDLGSRNGTLVNGERVLQHCLREGDRIAIGSSLAKVELKDVAEVAQRRAGEQRRRRPNDVAGRSMTGSIEDIPLMDVLQWLATSRKTGCLKVRDVGRGRVGALHLREGRVYYADIVGNRLLHPEKALLRMLNWDRGMFELENTPIDNPPLEINQSLEHMLMEAARQQDELANLGKKASLPVYGQTVTVVKPSPVRWNKLSAAELDLVQDVLEAGGWWEVMDSSTVDDITLMKQLVGLRNKGVLSF
ncbi:MAG: DUF4388 domain-containing protein [Deltaproteobacteria bacterium]|nr:DUF4388 domain-containing protein [Deltaproteobacteria bacterium]MBK8235432.1 DUF4388 domain-containing protein [Deltaproteobacteria bacterium]MBK8716245.1 DUF4388 domain-containing protein [Deltaproteobacteria bacterium]MBP7290364.1 DUF4388 domain-containing protein [Nannocystaceae bacterium]